MLPSRKIPDGRLRKRSRRRIPAALAEALAQAIAQAVAQALSKAGTGGTWSVEGAVTAEGAEGGEGRGGKEDERRDRRDLGGAVHVHRRERPDRVFPVLLVGVSV